jgi:hydroxyacylglutathione hydrolase
MRVLRLRARTDNYVWLIVDDAARACVAVDPSEAAPVEAALAESGLALAGIWCTHHHHDHVGGNEALAARWPGIPVVASEVDRGRVPAQTQAVREGDEVRVGGLRARVVFIPGHTRGHVAYVMEDGGETRLFCGDTLFGGGCGRLFEGTPAEMQRALARLRELPDDTFVHCGHEYTWHNLRWGVEVDPDNAALRARHARVAADPAQLTVPTRLGEEKAANPFLRWDAPALRARAGSDDPVAVFAWLRAAKDAWRG